ncbi:hypothetical protein CONLIGDRAFT_687711 [Coniochaeta ligniaria NRRL 30616]|uniref:Uncharacterized protein n=1 Tax=Coniochaeta ligniaria NRRL 30616 TaxID=1408157 RepID=A0A1J7I457_9PEZI|nr:hypothetical protein CONLIGDRAFT_687711 [Coniochaeta ligniaria NRRL 30616]
MRRSAEVLCLRGFVERQEWSKEVATLESATPRKQTARSRLPGRRRNGSLSPVDPRRSRTPRPALPVGNGAALRVGVDVLLGEPDDKSRAGAHAEQESSVRPLAEKDFWAALADTERWAWVKVGAVAQVLYTFCGRITPEGRLPPTARPRSDPWPHSGRQQHRQTTAPTVMTSFYILFLGSYCALYTLDWVWRALDVYDSLGVLLPTLPIMLRP